MSEREVAAEMALVLDFDGTLALADVGDAICDRFAPPAWREVDAAWDRGELSLPEAQRRMWRLVRARPEELRAFLGEVGALRDGLAELMDTARGRGAALVLASGGFDFYIEPLLGARRDAFLATYYNVGRFVGGGVEIDFPHARLACERVAICKGKLCDEARARTGAAEVAFVGDGSSDVCAIGHADRLFAVRGGKLERMARERGAAVTPFDRLDEVSQALFG